MRRVKGCLNSKCTEYKKTYYKPTDEYCVKCGTKLNYVCKYRKCFKLIPDNVQEVYCPVHLAEIKDRREQRSSKAVKAGGGVAAFLGIASGAYTVIKSFIKK